MTKIVEGEPVVREVITTADVPLVIELHRTFLNIRPKGGHTVYQLGYDLLLDFGHKLKHPGR